jgi:hypothetical protein
LYQKRATCKNSSNTDIFTSVVLDAKLPMSKGHVTDMMAKAKRLPETDTAVVVILDKANAIKITYKRMHIFFLHEKPIAGRRC